MTLVSYAQNFEDVILGRALKQIQAGRYIDIGAWEPELHSVSKAFYDLGWRGVHVEPVAFYAAKLRKARPDEVVVEAAIGPIAGEIEFSVIADTGLSTGNVEIARKHSSLPFAQTTMKVLSMTLAELLDAYASDVVHWMKIDVEGMEAEVLKSWQDHPARPWILVIEATVPGSPLQNHELWEAEVLRRDYRFVYFDGVNRFYVHKQQSQLFSAFGPGPNVFDDFVLFQHQPRATLPAGSTAEDRDESVTLIAELRRQLQEASDTMKAQGHLITDLRLSAAVLENQLAEAGTKLAEQKERIASLERHQS